MLDTAALFSSARDVSVLLAPNLRAARQLRRTLSALPTNGAVAGAEAPSAAGVVHWRGWMETLWQDALLRGVEERALLTSAQERLLWEDLLDADAHVERTDALVDLCLTATDLAYRYGAAEAVLDQKNVSGDAAQFVRWFRDFDERCRSEACLPSSALEGALGTHLLRAAIPAPERIALCGLGDLVPSQEWLLDCLREAGTSLTSIPNRAQDASPSLMGCSTAEDETAALTERCATLLTRAEQPSLAIIVPDLSGQRTLLDRAMRRRFSEASEAGLQEERRPLWEFSAGRPLASMAMAGDALRLLTWTCRELTTPELSSLLRSPYFAWPVSADRAASLDAALLRRSTHLRATWSARQVAHTFAKAAPDLAALLSAGAPAWAGLHRATGTFNAFVQRTRTLLRTFGWPGLRPRTSEEFQVVQRWEATLDSLATLDLVRAETTWVDFCSRLERATRDVTFARENTGAPIQFLTAEESTGVEADETWVMHADEGTWNSRNALHPLLPRHLQQRFGMPGADPRKDQARFYAQVQRIAQISPKTTFTFAKRSDTGEQRPSPVVLEFAGQCVQGPETKDVLHTVQASATLEEFEDDGIVPLSMTGDSVRGGVRVLQSQAACAFRAFAELRLGSSALEATDLGMDARERGDLLHRSMQAFWQTTEDQTGLKRLIANGRLTQAVEHAVTHALAPHERAGDVWSNAYLHIQRDRLTWILEQWLRKEAERPDFRVLATEQSMTVSVGPLPLTVKVDRIDEVRMDGKTYRVIVDYKTGDQKAKRWEGDRPEEPQLPLYATATPVTAAAEIPGAPVGAIAFAVIRPGEGMHFESLPKKTALLVNDTKATTEPLGAELEQWRSTLQTLAEDYASGIASVGPKEYPATCRFCEQRMLCRLNPELLDGEAGDAEGDA